MAPNDSYYVVIYFKLFFWVRESYSTFDEAVHKLDSLWNNFIPYSGIVRSPDGIILAFIFNVLRKY